MGSKFLVVERDPAIQNLLSTYLGAWAVGATVDVVEDGRQALAKLDQHDYTLVLLDYALPANEGREVLHFIRQNYPSFQVVVMVGNSAKEEDYRTIFAEGGWLLFRPFDREQLEKVFGRLKVAV